MKKGNNYNDNRIFTLNEPNAPRINPALACEIGLNESIILLQVEFWISISNNIQDGMKWTYQSVRDMKDKSFPFWSISTINRAVNKLIDEGYLIEGNYNKKKYDKTRWFSLNFNKLSELKSISVKGHETHSSQNDTGSTPHKIDIVQNDTGSSQSETGLVQNDTGSNHNDTTIPYTTTENTLDITSFNQSPKLSTEEKENERVNEFKQIINNINLEDFREYSSAVERCIRDLYYRDKPLSTNGTRVPPSQIREDLKRLEWKHIDLALRTFINQSEQQEIRNELSYLSTLIYNSIFDSQIKLESEVNYNKYR